MRRASKNTQGLSLGTCFNGSVSRESGWEVRRDVMQHIVANSPTHFSPRKALLDRCQALN